MGRIHRLFLVITTGYVFAISLAHADDSEESQLSIGAYLDFRGISADRGQSWLDGGFGKSRYGSEGNDRTELLRPSQIALLLEGELNESLSVQLHGNLDLESDRGFASSRFDLVEGSILHSTLLNQDLQLDSKVGVFFPPVSIEHVDTAWTSLYTITPSAANSWIADEVRTIGAEFSLSQFFEYRELTFSAAIFGVNDTAGALLAWRGWAMGNRLTLLGDRLPLAPLPAFEEGGLFYQQDDYTEPFTELDNRPGYYLSLLLADYRYLEASVLWYDNLADPLELQRGQYAWRTKFSNLSIRAPLGKCELLSQLMFGSTEMGGGSAQVDNDYYAFYVLGSFKHWEHRISIRFDRFEVMDRDQARIVDNNDERGFAWTVAYFYELTRDMRIGMEALRIESRRPARETLGLGIEDREYLFQLRLSYDFNVGLRSLLGRD